MELAQRQDECSLSATCPPKATSLCVKQFDCCRQLLQSLRQQARIDAPRWPDWELADWGVPCCTAGVCMRIPPAHGQASALPTGLPLHGHAHQGAVSMPAALYTLVACKSMASAHLNTPLHRAPYNTKSSPCFWRTDPVLVLVGMRRQAGPRADAVRQSAQFPGGRPRERSGGAYGRLGQGLIRVCVRELWPSLSTYTVAA